MLSGTRYSDMIIKLFVFFFFRKKHNMIDNFPPNIILSFKIMNFVNSMADLFRKTAIWWTIHSTCHSNKLFKFKLFSLLNVLKWKKYSFISQIHTRYTQYFANMKTRGIQLDPIQNGETKKRKKKLAEIG